MSNRRLFRHDDTVFEYQGENPFGKQFIARFENGRGVSLLVRENLAGIYYEMAEIEFHGRTDEWDLSGKEPKVFTNEDALISELILIKNR